MHLVTLVEDTKGREDLKNRFGLSLFLETEGGSLLFDTGQDATFLANARTLGLDLSRIDIAVLSHGHYDHGGGLGAFFAANQATPLFLGKGAGGPHYARVLWMNRYIGLDQAVLEQHRDRLKWVEKDTELAPGIDALMPVKRVEPIPRGNRRILLKTGEGFIPDPFDHELTCVVREPDGMIVLAGCGHSGIVNMVAAAKERFPGVPVKAVVGGFHLIDNPLLKTLGATPGEIREMAQKLVALRCQRVLTGHCTGKKAAGILKDELGDRLGILNTGYTTDL
jgi:7,8-dihydropterin-6-yl-methyl-4-(beta-D-ribofuranosyl)aminobenzene 5'-phosphate synthase